MVIQRPEEADKHFPLHTLENILCFSYKGASPALMGKCSRMGIGLSFFTPRGQFLTRCWGENNGNVLLRKEQYPPFRQPNGKLPYRQTDDLRQSV